MPHQSCQGRDVGFCQSTGTCQWSAALTLVNLQDVAKGVIYKNLPRERRADSGQSTRSYQGSDAGFCQSIDLAKGAVLDAVDL